MTAAVSVASKAATAAKGAGTKAATAAKGAGTKAGAAATGTGARAPRPRAGAGPAGKRTPAGDQQRAAVQAIKDARPEPAAAEEAGRNNPVAQAAGVSPEPVSRPQLPAPVSAAASTGSGFLLGVVAWGFGLAYLRGGMAEVKRLANAKLLNKVTA